MPARSSPGIRARLGNFLLDRPFLRRLTWHARRVSGAMDRKNMLRISIAVVAITLLLALLVNVVEGRPITFDTMATSVNWAVHAVFGKGDSAYITTLGGFVVSWIVVLFGAALVGMITAGLVAVAIEYLLKEGQGMGAAGFRGHIVICGWNATARELISELRGDDYKQRAVVVHNSDHNPAGDGIYFVKGDQTSAADLARAGIEEASAAIVFPVDDSND
jgi:voltage-gated potassium channel